MPERRLGVHTSIAGGLPLSLRRAAALGCNTLQIFSHNPRGWAVKPMSEGDASRFRALRTELDISPVYVHTSYLINIASCDARLRRKSIDLLTVEMDRADSINADYVVLHTGSAAGDDESSSRKRAADALDEIARMGRWKAGLLLENTAGEKGDISSRIIDMAEIMSAVRIPLISGICFDTCHAFAAGYDIRDEKGIWKIADEIGESVGPDKLKLIHLNDSKGGVGSHIDRHEHIGSGKIGAKGLRKFINHPPFKYIPLILETPRKRESDDPTNLKYVRRMLR